MHDDRVIRVVFLVGAAERDVHFRRRKIKTVERQAKVRRVVLDARRGELVRALNCRQMITFCSNHQLLIYSPCRTLSIVSRRREVSCNEN